MTRPSLRRSRGLASYYVTASLLWLAAMIAVTASLAAGDLRAVVTGGARWRLTRRRRLDVPGCYEIYGPEEAAMMTHTTIQALGQARLADLHDQARRDALARAARRARRARRQHATHRATALRAALTQAGVPRRKTSVGAPGRVMRDG